MARVEASEQLRSLLARRNPDEPEPQHAATSAGKRSGSERGIVGCRDRRPHLRQESLPGRCEGHAEMISTQQIHAELPLESGDRLRQHWLREVQLLSGGCHLPFFGNRYEVAQVAHLNRHRKLSRRGYPPLHKSRIVRAPNSSAEMRSRPHIDTPKSTPHGRYRSRAIARPVRSATPSTSATEWS